MTYRANLQMITLAALIAVGGTAAYAQDGRGFGAIDTDGNGQVTASELEAHAAARFARADSNGDGFLTEDEMQRPRNGDRAGRIMERLDTNKDGTLDQAELAAAQGKRAARMVERLDTNKDGALDQAELQAAGGKMSDRRAGRVLERLDANGDSKVTLAEMTAKRSPAQLIERLDENGDGTLSEAEFAKARDEMRKRAGEKRDG